MAMSSDRFRQAVFEFACRAPKHGHFSGELQLPGGAADEGASMDRASVLGDPKSERG